MNMNMNSYAERRISKFNFAVPADSSINNYRHAYTFDCLQEKYPLTPQTASVWTETCSHRLWRWLRGLFPIINTITTYQRSYILPDVFAGLSLGFLHMPQALAYGILASLTPISGLYTSVFPLLVYTIFGTSIHVSIGTNSIVSLITADMVNRELSIRDENLNLNVHLEESVKYEKEAEDYKLGVAMASAFICGAILVTMGIFRLGFLTSYMSSSFIGGFTTGSAMHILTSQVSNALHIKGANISGLGKVIKTYVHVFKNIEHTNLIDLVISAFTFCTIVLFAHANKRVKPIIKFDIPINLILVVVGAILSYELNLKKFTGINTIGHVASGFPSPVMPTFSVWKNIIGDSFIMALVSFSINISMAILIARIHHQEINVNKELIAYGMCNLVSSPFHCHISSASPVRCMLLHNEGAKSMLHSVASIILLLVIIFGLGALFEHLPLAILAGVIIAAIRGLLLQSLQLPNLWKTDKVDFMVWVSTFCMTTFVDISYGLVFGLVVTFVGVIINSQRVQGSLVVKAVTENIFIHGENRVGVQHIPDIRIFFFPAMLAYFNAEVFKKQLFKKILDPTSVDALNYQVMETQDDLVIEDKKIRCIILDCSAMTHIDTDGVNMLKTLVLMYHRVGVQILLVRCLSTVYQKLDKSSFFTILPRTCVFYELQDALLHERYTRVGVTLLNVKSSFTISPPRSMISSSEISSAYHN